MRAYLEAARRNRKLQRIAFTAAVFAAVFVVFGVFWALKNTGIAMTGDPTCGFAEHTHTDACYEQTLVCGQEESAGHTHSVANGCYASAGAAATNGAAAPAADGAAAEQTLTCTTPEAPAHTHTQACYEQTLTCTTPEHTHSESCYGDADADVETAEDWEATLPSTLTNKWPADVVAVAQSQLDYAESTTNVTTDDNGDQKGYTRYGAWSNDPYADWSVPFAAFCLHYAGADDYPAEQTAPAWAETLHRDDYKLYHSVESGYAPKPGDVVFLRADEHKEDAEKVATERTKAAEALAQAEEAAAQAQNAEATQDEAAQGADAGAEAEAAQDAEAPAQQEAAQQARIEAAYADVAALADHVGIVEEVLPADQNNPERIRVIEGDSDNKVQRVDYERSADRTDERILGYAELPEDAEALQDIVDANRAAAGATQNESEAQDQSENQITQTFEGEGYTVKASYGPEAQLPEGAELRATEYAKSSRDYQDYYAEAAAQYGWEDDRSDSLRLFDVGFYVGDQEVEPAAPVKVTITYAGQQQEVNYEIIHFGDELETVETQTTTNDNSQDISFTVDSFSVFGVSPLQAEGDAGANGRASSDSAVSITPHKTIDAFRDGTDNPDTTLDNDASAEEKTDLYRLYLDAELSNKAKPIDLLLVVDQSGSMHNDYSGTDTRDMTKENGEEAYRDEALRLILNGASSEDDSAYEANKQSGLIYQFLKENPDNRFAVVGFQGAGYTKDGYDSEYFYYGDSAGRSFDEIQNVDAKDLQSWTREPAKIGIKGIQYAATNYYAGMTQAEKMLEAAGNSSERQRIIVFLSDGIPTCAIGQGSAKRPKYDEVDYSKMDRPFFRDSVTQNKDLFTESKSGKYWRVGNGGGTDYWTNELTARKCGEFQDLANRYGAPIYTVSLCDDDAGEKWLKPMSDATGAECIKVNKTNGRNPTQELRDALKELLLGESYSDFKIEDTLSDYVRYYTVQPDLKVEIQYADGSKEPLYENGAKTDYGKNILDSVGYDENSKKVTATFEPTFMPAPGSKVVVSFNVKTTKQAYEEYKVSGYDNVVGAEDTDYSYTAENGDLVQNDTSSNKGGFHSNADEGAKLTYKKDGTERTELYPHPVVQVDEKKSAPSPDPLPTSDSSFEAHKTIDAFRDGDPNPDTELDTAQNVDKTDLYRLYLDAQAGQGNTPVDLMIVVDQSGSMHDKKDMEDENNPSGFRDAATRLVLNGTAEKGKFTDSGLISQFLSLNTENKVAVVGFQGEPSLRLEWSGEEYRRADDTDLLGGWKTDPQYVEVEGKTGRYGEATMHGTNYCAGLLKASEMLAMDGIKGNGHKKVMLFLSDGVPTLYLEQDGGIHRKYGNRMDASYDGPLTGNSGSRNESLSASAALTYFENCIYNNFIKPYKDDPTRDQTEKLTCYTVAIAGDITDSKLNDSNFILNKMATSVADGGHGKCFSATQTDQLRDTLKKLMVGESCKEVTITDSLSTYVDLADVPDFKVTLSKADGAPETLYENSGVATKNGGSIPNGSVDDINKYSTNKNKNEQILKSVTYDSGSKRLTAVFNKLEPGTTVTLSFNVKANQTAYDTYAKDGYNGVTGQDNTDYASNATSSGQGGFRSNYEATLTYKKEGDTTPTTLGYPHPVVQVAACDFVLEKRSDSGSLLEGAEFDLYRDRMEGEEGVAVEGLPGTYVKVDQHGVTGSSSASGQAEGQFVFTNLIPSDVFGGNYYLVETKAPLGYTKLTKPISFTLPHGTDSNGKIVGTKGQIVDDGGKVADTNESIGTLTETTKDNKTVPLVKVVNEGGVELPMTGGSGVGFYLAAGTLLMACAAVGLAAKRRRGARV